MSSGVCPRGWHCGQDKTALSTQSSCFLFRNLLARATNAHTHGYAYSMWLLQTIPRLQAWEWAMERGWHCGQDKTALSTYTPSSGFLFRALVFRSLLARTVNVHTHWHAYSVWQNENIIPKVTGLGMSYGTLGVRFREVWYGFSRPTCTCMWLFQTYDMGFYNCTCTIQLTHWSPYTVAVIEKFPFCAVSVSVQRC